MIEENNFCIWFPIQYIFVWFFIKIINPFAVSLYEIIWFKKANVPFLPEILF